MLLIETIDRIKYASFQFNYFSNDSSFIRCENSERLRLHPDFNPHAFGHCVIFSGKKVTVPPSPEVPERLWVKLRENVWTMTTN